MNVAPLEIWSRYMLAMLSCWMEPKAPAPDPSNKPAGILIAHPSPSIHHHVCLSTLFIYIYMCTQQRLLCIYITTNYGRLDWL